MSDHVYKLLELTGSSPVSIEGAVQKDRLRSTPSAKNVRYGLLLATVRISQICGIRAKFFRLVLRPRTVNPACISWRLDLHQPPLKVTLVQEHLVVVDDATFSNVLIVDFSKSHLDRFNDFFENHEKKGS